MHNDFIYDLESYPNVFSAVIVHAPIGTEWIFEVSDRVNQSGHLLRFLAALASNPANRMVGYNNVGYDYPILHHLMRFESFTADNAYQKSMSIIETPWHDRFKNTVWPSDMLIKQVDLFKVHHFDNAARSTSLKQIEIALRMPHVADLPFPPGTVLSSDQIPQLLAYNRHDVSATLQFYHESASALQFRDEMSEALGADMTNTSDTNIGSRVFIARMETAAPGICGKSGSWKQTPRDRIALADCIFPYVKFQTPEFNSVLDYLRGKTITRTKGALDDLKATCHGLEFVFGTGGIHGAQDGTTWRSTPPARVLVCGGRDFADCAMMERHLQDLKNSRGISAIIHGGARGADSLAGDFAQRHGIPVQVFPADWNAHGRGAGPIRNAQMLKEGLPDIVVAFPGGRGTTNMIGISRKAGVEVVEAPNAVAKTGRVVQGRDVRSYYPNLAIANRVYPAHLSDVFCDVYKDVYDQRISLPKSDPRNKALKLALNGTYGNSNSAFSPFYDPQYTMTITINGQLLLCMLAERLAAIPTLELIQVNTDGIEYIVDRDKVAECDRVSAEWETLTGLELESDDFTSFHMRDVNSYLAIDAHGAVKCKGAFEYQHGLGWGEGWHKNQSCKIVAMAAEAYLVHGVPVADTVAACTDAYLFMHTLKVQRGDRVMLGGDLSDYECQWTPPDAKGRPIKRKMHTGGMEQQRTGRYYIARTGGAQLWKVMKPLPKLPMHERPQAIMKGHGVRMSNDLHDFDWARLDLNYYVTAAQDLVDSTGNSG